MTDSIPTLVHIFRKLKKVVQTKIIYPLQKDLKSSFSFLKYNTLQLQVHFLKYSGATVGARKTNNFFKIVTALCNFLITNRKSFSWQTTE